MGFTLGGKRGIVSDVNVVPLIDVLLVLLVIFMIIPHEQMGLRQFYLRPVQKTRVPLPETIIVSIASDGSLRINRVEVPREELRSRLERIFALRATGSHFFKVIGLSSFMRLPRFWISCSPPALSSVGLLTSELEKNR